MTILYINEEHCTSLEQLRGYFENSLGYDSPIFYELLEYARFGDMSKWLREKGESSLADKVDSIDGNLGDSAYFFEMRRIILDIMGKSDDGIIGGGKPGFSDCFTFERAKCEFSEEGLSASIYLKVLLDINETFKLSVQTDNWGILEKNVNPSMSNKGEVIVETFSFSKNSNICHGNIKILADDEPIAPVGIPDKIEFSVNDINFKMVKVDGGTFSYARRKSGGNKQMDLNSFYIGETPVTQALWKAVMRTNPSRFTGDDLPVENVSWDDCQEFIKELNAITDKTFRLPIENEWEFAARGGNMSKNTKYSGSDHIYEVAWYNENSLLSTHPVKTKNSNELGIYDMSGNVWELCQIEAEPYGDDKSASSSERYCLRGGCYCDTPSKCLTSFYRDGGFDLCVGLRIALSDPIIDHQTSIKKEMEKAERKWKETMMSLNQQVLECTERIKAGSQKKSPCNDK